MDLLILLVDLASGAVATTTLNDFLPIDLEMSCCTVI